MVISEHITIFVYLCVYFQNRYKISFRCKCKANQSSVEKQKKPTNSGLNKCTKFPGQNNISRESLCDFTNLCLNISVYF